MSDPINILLVEDNPGDALLIRQALTESLYKTASLFEADTLANAIRFKDKRVILLLLDLGLPDCDGLQTVKVIKEHFPDSAVIVLTGLDDEQMAVDTLREGAQNFLNKSEVDYKVLERTIRFSLERHMIIQQLKRVENELIQNKFFLEKAQEVAHTGSWVIDFINETAEWSDEAQRILGNEPGMYQEKSSTFFSMIHPDDTELLNSKIEEAIQEKKPFELTHRIILKDGAKRWIRSKAEIVYDKDGEAQKMIGTIHDITTIKDAEEKIVKGNRMYSFISHISQTIVHVKDQQTLFERACEIAIEQGMFKMAWIGIADFTEQKIGLAASFGATPADVELLKEYKFEKDGPIAKVLYGLRYYVVDDCKKDLGTLLGEYAKKRGFGSGISLAIKKYGKTIGAFNLYSTEANFFDKEEIKMLNEAVGDISYSLENFDKENQRTIAEENLERSEARLKEAQAIALIGSWEIDLIKKVQLWSEGLYEICDIDKSKEPTIDLFMSLMHPDDLEDAISNIENAFLTHKDSSFNFRFKKKSGEIRYGFAEYRFEFDNRRKPLRFYGIIKDITDQKRNEDEREKIIKDIVQRNSDLEQFAFIVSHNLRLPVANIIGFADILKNDELEEAQKLEFINAILTSVKKLDEVVNDLNHVLQVRREISENKEVVYFSRLIESIRNSIASMIKEDETQIITDFTAIDKVFTIKSYMYSIFYNLISNSIKYRQKNTPLRIEVTSKTEEDKVLIYFKDNGSGINLIKNKNDVFGLYKRFHSKVEGKGMGLFMVKTQVETLGGRISIQSEVDNGTEFTIEFDGAGLK
ncbi:hypothetical protein BH11BAC2_BH11BAC2_18050 [soil metagenome]